MVVRRAQCICLFFSLLLPVFAFSATSTNAADKAKMEKQIKLEEQKLAEDKKKLDAIKLKLGLEPKKSKKNSDESSSIAQKPTSHWAGSNAQLGLVVNTGNTESTNFSGGLNLVYKNQPWTNTAQLQMQLNRSQGDLTKERYYASDQIQYSFSKERQNFVYGHAEFTDDKFSPYEYQMISSAGYGRDIWKTPTFTISLQGGPGVRYDVVRDNPQNHTNFVFYTQGNANWQVTKDMNLTEQVQYTMGSPYNYLQSVTALTNKLTGNLALQVSYTIQYYSQIPVGSANTKNLDTITNLALVYNF